MKPVVLSPEPCILNVREVVISLCPNCCHPAVHLECDLEDVVCSVKVTADAILQRLEKDRQHDAQICTGRSIGPRESCGKYSWKVPGQVGKQL